MKAKTDRDGKLQTLLMTGVEEGIFPGAVLLVASAGKTVFFESVGNRTLMPERLPMEKETIFDLASLTKPLATTLVVMTLVDRGIILLDTRLCDLLPNASLGEKKDLTPRLLLCHSAGLVDWKPFYEKLVLYPLEDRKGVLRKWIIEEPFAYEPGRGNLYSDLGFMLLEWIVEEKGGDQLPGYVQKHFYGPLGLWRTLFVPIHQNPPESPPKNGRELTTPERGALGRKEFAATEMCPWRKRVIQGEVHDDNAWVLGGFSGHAGLFSDAEGVYAIADMLRKHFLGSKEEFFKRDTVREFFTRQNIVEGSDWALGWDTRALKGSSAGKYFSRDSVGHTGFTGTSIWMDLEKDVIAVFLSNRVHPKRDDDRIKKYRPLIHDAIMEELGLGTADR